LDIFKELEIEIEGICGTIKGYTSEPYINNVLNQLKKAVEIQDRDSVLFLLRKIQNWYNDNISVILSNRFVSNHKIHLDLKENIGKYIDELPAVIKLSELINNKIEGSIQVTKKIFISHSSKDEIVCSAFVELLETIGISDELILYTSSPRHGVPGDVDIFEYLRKHLSEGITVFYMLSDNYYNSVYCLNEMGASWVVQNDFSTFILPNFSVKIDGVIDKNKKAYYLNAPIDLIHLKNKLVDNFTLQISETKWEDAKNKFLKIVDNL
jgi:hypothetical protein